MVQGNRRKNSIYHSSTRVEDGMPITGLRLYIEDMDICGNSVNRDVDDDVSSIGNSLHRYIDSSASVTEDVDCMKAKMHVLGLSATDFIGVSVSQDSATAELDVSLIQTAPPGSQPDPFNRDGDVSKGWYISHSLCLPRWKGWHISHSLCLPRWIQRAPTWLQLLVIGSLMLLIISIVVAGIALSEMNNDRSQSNVIRGGPEYIPTPSPITFGQTNVFSPTVNIQDQINESQPTSSPLSPLESFPKNIFSPTNNIQDQIEDPPQLRDPSAPSESGSSVPATATAAEDYLTLVEPPTSTPTAHPTQFPTEQPVNALVKPPTRAPATHPTQSPSAQPVDALVEPPTRAPTTHPTQLPSAQLVDASSTASSPPTAQFFSNGKRLNTYDPPS
jgi:hypothetical protein